MSGEIRGRGRPRSTELTPRQRQILEFIRAYRRERGIAPSIDDIRVELGLRSRSAVQEQLNRLERDGYLARDPGTRRAWRLTAKAGERRPGLASKPLPLLGAVAAGEAILAEENVEEIVEVPERLFGNGAEGFLLRVEGDSMIGAGLQPGDLLVVRRQEEAENGDIVVALVGEHEGAEEATVKRFVRERGKVRLEPANPAYKPIRAPYVAVLGKVVALIRSL